MERGVAPLVVAGGQLGEAQGRCKGRKPRPPLSECNRDLPLGHHINHGLRNVPRGQGEGANASLRI